MAALELGLLIPVLIIVLCSASVGGCAMCVTVENNERYSNIPRSAWHQFPHRPVSSARSCSPEKASIANLLWFAGSAQLQCDPGTGGSNITGDTCKTCDAGESLTKCAVAK